MTYSETPLLRYNQNVPRYTSYPTAPHFNSDITHKDYQEWLEAIPKNTNISLYIHIPFCPKLCWYCGCHTKATQRYTPIKNYLTYLKQEVAILATHLPHSTKLSHIHFGGGSPTILTPDDFDDLMQHIKSHFDTATNAEIAIELDPRGVSEEKVAAYKKHNVNRASIGVQDFDPDVQKAINRIQPFSSVYKAVQLLRTYGIDQINLDLMYGLPGQNTQSIEKSIEYSALLNPQRIAFFGYAHVPWMRPHMKLIDETLLPDAKQRLSLFQTGEKLLIKENYLPVGLDHFVKASDPMHKALESHTLERNFQGYTNDNSKVLIGIGTSSISKLPQGYIQNTPNNKTYEQKLSDGLLPTHKGILINSEDRLRKDIIEELMCYLQIDLKTICSKHAVNVNIFDKVLEELQPLVKDMLITIEKYRITINPKARQITRYVCAHFDSYYTMRAQQHAQMT